MKVPKFAFMKNRKYLFGLAILMLTTMFILSLIRGYSLDIEFKGGSLIEYSYTGEVAEEEAESKVDEVCDKPVSVRLSKNIADESRKIVVSVASKEPLETEELQALTNALTEAFPENNIEISNSVLISPTLGREMLMNGITALIVAFVLIIAYVWFSFRKMSGPSAGIMALVALMHDALMAVFAYVIMGSAINETIIAVVLTILGFSINDTIVVYDRIRENMNLFRGEKTLFEIVDLSLNQSVTRTVNTSLCVVVAVLVAYIYAVAYDLSGIKEFALPIMVGAISGTFSSLCLASPLWALWKEHKKTKKA